MYKGQPITGQLDTRKDKLTWERTKEQDNLTRDRTGQLGTGKENMEKTGLSDKGQLRTPLRKPCNSGAMRKGRSQ